MMRSVIRQGQCHGERVYYVLYSSYRLFCWHLRSAVSSDAFSCSLVDLTVLREICAPPRFVAQSDTQQELCMNDTEDQNRYLLNHASTSTKRHVGTGYL